MTKFSSPSSALPIFPPVILLYLFSISAAGPTTPGALTSPSAITVTTTTTTSSSSTPPTNTSSAASNSTSCTFTADPSCWWSSTAGIVSIVGIIVGAIGVLIAALGVHHNLRWRREDEARRTATEQRRNRRNPLKSAFWKKFWGR